MTRDDWQVGDLALCVSYGPEPDDWKSGTGGPQKGSIHAVAHLVNDHQGLWLNFGEFPESRFFSLGFRKIHPHQPDAEDAETIALQTGKPAKVAA